MSVSFYRTAAQPDFVTAVATVGPMEWIQPFDGVLQKVLFRQRYQQSITAWSPATIDTTRVEGGVTYLLSKEDDFSAIGGGQHQWYRYFACTPATRTEFTSYAAQFPAITSATFRRPNVNAVSPARITYDYIYAPTAPPSLAEESKWAITYQAITAPLLSGVEVLVYSVPSVGAYLSYLTTDATVATAFSITAEQQTLNRWIGNFYGRTTLQIKAK